MSGDAGMLSQQGLRRLRQPHPMIGAVLSAGPVSSWLAWHFPPAIDDVLGAHMPDLARSLPGQQDELERSPGSSGLIEGLPEQRQLTVGENALAARGLMTINPVAGIDRDHLLLHRPGKNSRGRPQHLLSH